MEWTFLYKGLVLGFSVAAPVGQIGILCINRTINKGYISGLITGLGAATADLIYGLVAGLGLTVISGFLLDYKVWIQIAGLIFLMYLGIKTLSKKQNNSELTVNENKGLLKDYLTTFTLTITNPLTILFFIALFGGLGLSSSGKGNIDSILLVLGVFLGSGVWWLFLSGLTYTMRKKLGNKTLKRIDLISGLIIITFGILITIDLINEMTKKTTAANNVYKTWQGVCVPETYQPAPTVFVVPTMTLYADCHVPYTNR